MLTTRSAALLFFLIEIASVIAWWLLLGFAPASRAIFFRLEFENQFLFMFLWPDILAICGSAIVAIGLLWSNTKPGLAAALWCHVGAVGYATICTINLWTLGATTPVSVLLMVTSFTIALIVAIVAQNSSRIEQSPAANLFRTSQSDNAAWILLRTLIYAALIWILTLWIAPSAIVQLERMAALPLFAFPGQFALSITIFAAGSGIGLTSAWFMTQHGRGTPLPIDCAPELVIAGPYRYVRNPMAVGGLLQGAAVGIGFGSVSVLLYTFFGLILWNYFVRPIEESDLHARFGEPYRQYCKDVRCWIPRFRS